MISEKQIAYHESGHAVIALALGLSVDYVSLYAGKYYAATMTRDAWLATDADIATRTTAFEQDLVVTVAGPLAQRRYAPAVPDLRAAFLKALGADGDQDKSDEQNAANLCMLIAALKHGIASSELALALFEQAQRKAEALLDAHWPAVARVAEALIVQTDLGPDDVEALIAEPISP